MTNGISFLPTVQAMILNVLGHQVQARALLDQGSESTFISESLVQSLGLFRQRVNIPITGVGVSKVVTVRHCVTFRLKSLHERDFEAEFDALVLSRPTGHLPSTALPNMALPSFANFKWADCNFYTPGGIDLILGVDAYATVIRSGLKRIGDFQIIAQNTAFGWTFSGHIQTTNSRRSGDGYKALQISSNSVGEEDLSEILRKFWAIEEVPNLKDNLSPDNAWCERFYETNHSRKPDGRYRVRLPFKSELPHSANSTRRLAYNSFLALLRRFERNPTLAAEYTEFMKEYEALGHMRIVPSAEISEPKAWYIPHHPVIQHGVTRSKLRVVFDASRRNADNHSLNEFLLPGPPLQNDLSLILIGWRQYRYAFTADMVKMYRQIEVDPIDQNFQRILWSPTPDKPPVDYQLTTVTYGMSAAPYLAIRTLKQLAVDEGSNFPLGAYCLLHETYVDDIFSGAEHLEDARQKRDQLISILQTAGINLDKWASNEHSLLSNHLESSHDYTNEKTIRLDQAVKTLGLLWKPDIDAFAFNLQGVVCNNGESTKRGILSSLARLFDPLGLLAPVVVRAKILLQDLWILRLDWDASLPDDILKKWHDYCRTISGLTEISISRWLGPIKSAKCELHGFADASMRAYAAAIYLRVSNDAGECWTTLLIAKSKVAPVKTVTIPKLELCGAVLLVKLFKYLRRIELFNEYPIIAWSDSRDALAWIRKHPSHWKVFVANRVSYIQTELSSAVWKYVSTHDNPADLATRGLDSNKLKDSSLWWYGPSWLKSPKEHWPSQPATINPERQDIKVFMSCSITREDSLLTRFSSLSKLIRVTAYCLRFGKNCRCSKSMSSKVQGFLTTEELELSRNAIIRLVQSNAFKNELICLKENRAIQKSSALFKLHPFLDEHGVIRVGGRLTHSALPFPVKHPPILPKTSNLSNLFIQDAHILSLHAGPTLTLGVLLHKVWIIGAIGLVKRHVRACMRCFRSRPRLKNQQMGNLPSARVTPSRPFSISGLDYAGPFKLRCAKGRGQRSYKGYIALFVCFSTKAVHLEAVGDLSTQSFLAAFRRFVSRRGICKKIYSDNGTNFQGADRELQAMFKRSSEFYNDIARDLAYQGVEWSFIPPHAPHFGGLWEAGVKATKHHLIRIIGENTLTFEEFATVLAEIEACLNSRPLCPLTGDIEDLRVLTPSHFLVGGPSSLIHDAPVEDGPENQRSKWRGATENFAVGQLVVVQDDRYPPTKWPLGRIVETHPGDDGLVRVATIKTSSTVLKRPIARLSPLPMQEDDFHQ
ncbi:uncharacterized protein [Prorops nasuta]|uniref:uncharacterized protein n=1 Tax=Prorops nasuta TaxID=863751 RepID=UPI0034CD4F3F